MDRETSLVGDTHRHNVHKVVERDDDGDDGGDDDDDGDDDSDGEMKQTSLLVKALQTFPNNLRRTQ